MFKQRVNRTAAGVAAGRILPSGGRNTMLKTMFMGAVLTAAALGTASAAILGIEPDSHRAAQVTPGDWTGCAGDTREWTPRTLKDGGGSARMPDASFGDEDLPKWGAAAGNCALV